MLRSVACVELLVSENAAEAYLHTIKDINSHYVKRDLVVIAEIVRKRLEPQSAELSFRAWADLLADTESPAAKKGFRV